MCLNGHSCSVSRASIRVSMFILMSSAVLFARTGLSSYLHHVPQEAAGLPDSHPHYSLLLSSRRFKKFNVDPHKSRPTLSHLLLTLAAPWLHRAQRKPSRVPTRTHRAGAR